MGTLMKNGVAYGGGSGGTSDYDDLSNKPSIENVTLSGNKSASDLGLVKDSDLANVAKTGSYNDLKNKPAIPSDLDDMSDVELITPTDGQVLKYNSTSGKWENGTGGGGGGSYTAGDGISIENNEISIDPMPAEDVDEVIDIYPTAGNLVSIVNAFNRGDLYSTEEKMIGQWINNKPVYQRTVQNTTLTTISNSSWDNYCSISGIENLVSWQFGRMNASGNVVDVMGDISCWYDANTSYLKVRSRTDNLSCTNGSVITIQYTKTTDTAISIGSETEYSTDEKVVGTWIDGKPVYQRMVELSNPVTIINANEWAKLDDVSSIAQIIKIMLYRDNGEGNHYGVVCTPSQVNISNNAIYVTFPTGQINNIYGYLFLYTKTTI